MHTIANHYLSFTDVSHFGPSTSLLHVQWWLFSSGNRPVASHISRLFCFFFSRFGVLTIHLYTQHAGVWSRHIALSYSWLDEERRGRISMSSTWCPRFSSSLLLFGKLHADVRFFFWEVTRLNDLTKPKAWHQKHRFWPFLFFFSFLPSNLNFHFNFLNTKSRISDLKKSVPERMQFF